MLSVHQNSLHSRRKRCIYNITITSGVVQGSCIGPQLFTVCINDVFKIFDADTKCKLYADDVKLYSEIVTDDHQARLQENLDALTR